MSEDARKRSVKKAIGVIKIREGWWEWGGEDWRGGGKGSGGGGQKGQDGGGVAGVMGVGDESIIRQAADRLSRGKGDEAQNLIAAARAGRGSEVSRALCDAVNVECTGAMQALRVVEVCTFVDSKCKPLLPFRGY